MGRKSRNTDRALIKAGIALIGQGNYDPTVRAICTMANVNQGMFVYYFGIKEEYMKVLFQKIYDEYLTYIQDYPDKNAKAAEQLQHIFYRMASYFVNNFNTAYFISSAFLKHKAASYFTSGRVLHFVVIRELIEKAQQEKDICNDLSSCEVYMMLHSLIIQPLILKNTILQKYVTDPEMEKLTKIDISSEESLQKRLVIAFKGLRP